MYPFLAVLLEICWWVIGLMSYVLICPRLLQNFHGDFPIICNGSCLWTLHASLVLCLWVGVIGFVCQLRLRDYSVGVEFWIRNIGKWTLLTSIKFIRQKDYGWNYVWWIWLIWQFLLNIIWTRFVKHNLTIFIKHILTIIVKHALIIFVNNLYLV